MTCVAYDAMNQESALELHSRAEPSVEAHHLVNGADTGRNSGGRRIKKLNVLSCTCTDEQDLFSQMFKE